MPQNENPIRWYFIVNPAAGRHTLGRRWPMISQQLYQAGLDFEAVLTQCKGHAIELAKTAIEAGHRHLVGVGGDGTNNEVINGILQQQVVPSQAITYTLLPIGTGNDWIRTHRIPKSLHAWIGMLRAGHTVLQDMGLVNYRAKEEPQQRYFANVAGLAYDAFVVRYAEHWPYRFYNQLIYLFLILYCLFKYQLVAATLRFAKQEISDRFYTINAGICRYSGGGMQLVPHARPDDGMLAITYAGALSKLDIVFNTYRFYTGTIGQHPKVTTEQTTYIKIDVPDGAPPTLLEVDGEFLGKTPCEISIVPQALCVVVPIPKMK